MEPKFTGFCLGCHRYSKELVTRVAEDYVTKKVRLGLFCPECLKRFKLFPYDGEVNPDDRD